MADPKAPPEPPLWHGHSWQPVGVKYDEATGRFTDGYKPTGKDWTLIGRDPRNQKDGKG